MKTIIFDSGQAVRCGHCAKLIAAAEPKTLIGYKDLLIVLHPQCWSSEAILRQTILQKRSVVTEDVSVRP